MTDRLRRIITIAREGGELALSMRRSHRHEIKPDGSIVTDADVAVQDLVVTRLRAEFPDYDLVGEESGLAASHVGKPTFCVDPIDGTDSYHRGFPHFGVAIGLVEGGRCTLGVFFNPSLEVVYAADEGRAFINGELMNLTGEGPVGDADLLLAPSNSHRYYKLSFDGKVRGYGSVAQHLCYVASGQATAALAFRSHIWDLAGAVAIVEAAGGIFRGLDGGAFEPASFLDGRKIVEGFLAAAPQRWDDLAALIRPIPR